MNRYGRLALVYQTLQLEDRLEIGNPIAHYTDLGERIQAMVTERRDEILGPMRDGESLEDYRQRGYQALRRAEELVLTEMVWEPAEIKPPEGEYDGELVLYYEWLDEMRVINPEGFLEDPDPEELRDVLESRRMAVDPDEIASWYEMYPSEETSPTEP